jgi:hypothetical protein
MDETTANLKNKTDVLRAEIERTRYETVQTMSELQRRLSMDNVRTHARQSIRDATVGKAQIMTRKATYKTRDWGSSVYQTVKHNPIPMVLVGTGIAWLIRSKPEDKAKEPYSEYPRGGYPRGYVDQTIEEGGDLDYRSARRYYDTSGVETGAGYVETGAGYQEHDRQEEVRSKVNEGRDKMKAAAGEFGRRASDMSDTMRSRARDMGEKARETSERFSARASELGHRAQERGSRVRRDFFNTLDTNPLAIAGALFAVGAAIGLFAPRTRKERELMGSTRDNLVDRAREAGQEQMEKVRSVAHEAKEAAIEEAQRQDLMDRQTAEKVEEKSSSAMHKAEDKGREAMNKTQETMDRAKEEGISKAKPTFKKS